MKHTAAQFARWLAAAALSAAAFGAQAQSADDKAILERIKPVGAVCIEGDAACAAAVPVASGGKKSGEELFNSTCKMCHGTGVAGAPVVGDKAAWAPRIGQGMETLFKHAINGFTGTKGAMPARGTCASCSDDEIKGAVEYMVKQSK